MKKWVCPVCGYVHEGETAPEFCPQCKVPGSKFTVQAGEKVWAAEPEALRRTCTDKGVDLVYKKDYLLTLFCFVQRFADSVLKFAPVLGACHH